MSNFEEMLTGGHPNSLGRTVEVVEIILKNPSKITELYDCYFSKDEVVRLRVSGAFKRICKERSELLIDYIDLFINDISKINQASTQWTLAQLFLELKANFSDSQYKNALKILKHNLENHKDWIVLNQTIKTLENWVRTDESIKTWLIKDLQNLVKDKHKSVSTKAKKALETLK